MRPLLLNTQGHVACATTANIFSVHAGRLLTPPLEAGALPGTVRALILEELAQEANCDAGIIQLSEAALRNADELFLHQRAHGHHAGDNSRRSAYRRRHTRPAHTRIPHRVREVVVVGWRAAA